MNCQDHRFVQNCSHLEVRSHQSVGNSHSWELKKKKRRSLKQDLKGSIALSFLSFFLTFFNFPSLTIRQADNFITVVLFQQFWSTLVCQ